MSKDYCTKEGAHILKEKIESFWRKQGYYVDIMLVNAGFMPTMRSARTDVRSDMVNGMPRKDFPEDSY